MQDLYPQIVVRKALMDDRAALWDWFSNSCRVSFFKTEFALSQVNYKTWFDNAVKSSEDHLFVGITDTIRIGAVRFIRRVNNEFEAFAFLKPTYCGKNLLWPLLNSGIEELKKLVEVKAVYTKIQHKHPVLQELSKNKIYKINEDSEGTTIHLL